MHLDQDGVQPESQRLFRKCRGTKHLIFTARRLQDNCEEQNFDLHIAFVYLTKACNTASHDGLEHDSKIRLYSHGTKIS